MKEKGIIDIMLDNRIEEIAKLTDMEIKTYYDRKDDINLEDYVKDLTKEQLDGVNRYIDEILSNVFFEVQITNEKYYRHGVADGMGIAIESFKVKEEYQGLTRKDLIEKIVKTHK